MHPFIIPFVFQHWSDKYNWWVPNNWPKDFVVDGEERSPYSHHGSYFDLDKCAVKDELLFNYKNIKFFHLADVPLDAKYIYPVMLFSWDYFFKMKSYGFKFVDERVLTDVRENRARLVLIHPYEGMCGEPDWAILNQWATANGLTKDQIYFVHGNFNFTDKDYNFTYYPVSFFQINWPIETSIINYSPESEKNLFLCYNRVRRKHRAITICELINNNLFDRGIVSYFDPTSDTVTLLENNNRVDLVSAAETLKQLSPVELEYDLSVSNPIHNLNKEHHRQTFLSLVTETLVEDEVENRAKDGVPLRFSPAFFSEKTWKPIAIGQPFIVVAAKGHLKHLKELGYKTFNTWWSEEYDNADNTNDKVRLIIQELVKLSKLSTAELTAMREEMIPVLEHNQQVYNNFRNLNKNLQMAPLYSIIKDIWNSF